MSNNTTNHSRMVRNFRKRATNSTNGVLNRLKSILNDADAVTEFYQIAVPHFPLFANKRCGQWAVKPVYSKVIIPQATSPIIPLTQKLLDISQTTIPQTTIIPQTTLLQSSADTIQQLASTSSQPSTIGPDDTVLEPLLLPGFNYDNDHTDQLERFILPNEPVQTNTAYFKSTDGHYNIWNFPVSRLNLPVFDKIITPHTQIDICNEFCDFLKGSPQIDSFCVDVDVSKEQSQIDSSKQSPPINLAEYSPRSHPNQHPTLLLRGGVLIDSTRKGKTFPDSFTRTVPIWAGVLNAAFSSPTAPPVPSPPHASSPRSSQSSESSQSPQPYPSSSNQSSTPNNSTKIISNKPHPTLPSCTLWSETDYFFTSPPWMLGSETDQIIDKITNTHMKTFIENLAPQRYQHYSSLFSHSHAFLASSNQQSEVNLHVWPCNSKIVPVWLHRESYQSSIQVMNQNFALFLTSYLFPIMKSITKSPESLFSDEEHRSIFNLAADFIISLIFKFNLGLYINIISYYNTVANSSQFDTIIASFRKQFILDYSCLSNTQSNSTHSTTSQNTTHTSFHLIIAFFQSISPLLHIPLILYSASLIDRFQRTYGENTAVYHHQSSDNVDNSIAQQDSKKGFCDNNIPQDSKKTFFCPYLFTPLAIRPKIDIPALSNADECCGTDYNQSSFSTANQSSCSTTSDPITSPYHTTSDSIKSPYHTTFLEKNEKNQCNDVNYIPGAGDDEETWAKIKVWGLKTISEMGWGEEDLIEYSQRGGKANGDEEDDSNETIIDNDINDDDRTIEKGPNNEPNPEDIQQNTNSVSDFCFDDDDDEYMGLYEVYLDLPSLRFSPLIPPNEEKFYKKVTIQCDFTMLYGDYQAGDVKHNGSDDKNLNLVDFIDECYENEDCWEIIYEQLYLTQATKATTQSHSDYFLIIDHHAENQHGHMKNNCSDEESKGSSCDIVKEMKVCEDILKNKGVQIDFLPLKTTPIFKINSPSTDSTINLYTLDSTIATHTLSALSCIKNGSGGSCAGHVYSNSMTHFFIGETQNPSSSPHITDLLSSTVQFNQNPNGAHNIQVILSEISLNQRVRQGIVNNLTAFLAILHKSLSAPSNNTQPLTSINNVQISTPTNTQLSSPSTNKTQPLTHSTIDVFLVNITPDVATTLILATLLFFTPEGPTGVTSVSTDPQPNLQVNVQANKVDGDETRGLPSIEMEEIEITKGKNGDNNHSFHRSVKLIPTYTIPSPLQGDNNTTVLPPAPRGVNTTAANANKTYIRQLTSHLIAIIGEDSGVGVFLPRDVQQQLNLYFCPRFERPPPKSKK